MMDEVERGAIDRDKTIPSPLNFKWNDDEDGFGAEGKDLVPVVGPDPFMEASLGGDEPGLRSDLMRDASLIPHDTGTGTASNDNGSSDNSTYNSNDSRESSSRKRRSTTGNAYSPASAVSSRRKKKPKGMPKRPLSAYNLFFQSQRVKILDENAGGRRRVGFEELGRVIGQKWKSLSPGDKKMYTKLAEKDNIRYRKEMDAYNDMKTKKLEESDKLPPIDFEEQASILRTSSDGGPVVRQEDSTRSTFHLQHPSEQPKFLRAGNGLSTSASPRSPQRATFSDGFSRQSVPASPRNQQRTLPPVPSSFPPSLPDIHQAQQYRSPFGVENGLQRPRTSSPPAAIAAAAAAASRAPGNHLNIPIPPPAPAVSDSIPVPPGMEMTLSHGGRDRKYRVQYTCYSMSRDAAQQYIESLVQGGPSSPKNNPQPGSYQGGPWGGL